jgi:hypothetical protein
LNDSSSSAARVVSLLRARRLISSDKVLCKYELHGTCTSKTCTDVHIDEECTPGEWRDFLSDLATFYSSLRPALYVSDVMLRKALNFQISAAELAITKGKGIEDCFATLIQAMSPLCSLLWKPRNE